MKAHIHHQLTYFKSIQSFKKFQATYQYMEDDLKPTAELGLSEKGLVKLKNLPSDPGVYFMRDRTGKILYIGKAKNLKKRVISYFQKDVSQFKTQPKVALMLPLIYDLDYITVKSEEEALILEAKLISQWQPRHNTALKDDKKFPMIQVDVYRTLPVFRITRNRNDFKSIYFGPFVYSDALYKTLFQMRVKFGILLGDTNPKLIEGDVYKLYDDVRGEIYGHKNEVTAQEYRKRVHEACIFLEGKTQIWAVQLQKDMQDAAVALDYEKAAECRDLINAINKMLIPTRKFTRDLKAIIPMDMGLQTLQEHLELAVLPKHIECFDISHISGTFVVASMVHFTDGKPDKNNYRHFRIKSFVGNDDFRAMEEVVRRRYGRLTEESKSFPQLIVIDGGRGQVNAALKAFLELRVSAPPLIGLAKRQETIIFADEREPMNLPENSPALHLLQRIRDEAHRFANNFNAHLRSKKIRESILDDLNGVGEKRKQLLLKKFPSITKLRSATVEELQSVEGIGPKQAQHIHQFMNGYSEPIDELDIFQDSISPDIEGGEISILDA